jgi:DNA mismatch repair protein MutL
MIKKIELLLPEVINQIAAGEVLENPASAVKELVENSIDAEALRIAVEIKSGGHQLICVEDDGIGMNREDAVHCLQRHATSKLRQTDDLLTLTTMGFRGEALAAIASVSQLEIQTFNGQESTCVKVDTGRIVSIGPCARNRGTTIDIRSLFQNVPARQKFQKSAASSGAQVLRVLQTIALAHPNIAFSLQSQGRCVFQSESCLDWRVRAKEILGPLSFEVVQVLDSYAVHGLIGAPEEAKGNRSGQYMFLNQRPIFSPLISRAVKDGYATRLNEAKYPSFLLFLTLPPDEFDINVHPQKRDARFQNESKVYRLVERSISKMFESMTPQNFASPLQFSDPMPLPWDVQMERPLNLQCKQEGDIRQKESQPSFILPSVSRKAIALIGSFALFEGDYFSLLDLKGAEARIFFEEAEEKDSEKETLSWPIEIELSLEEAKTGEELSQSLKKVGVEARFLGGRMLAVDAAPRGLDESEVSDFVARFKIERKAAAAISRFCRSRKKKYSLEEAALIEQRLAKCKDKNYDPLGRMIAREIREEQLGQWITGDEDS